MGGTSVLGLSDLGKKHFILPHVKILTVRSRMDIFKRLNLDIAVLVAKQS